MKTLTFIILLIIVGLVCFWIGYCVGAYREETNHYGIKKNKTLKL